MSNTGSISDRIGGFIRYRGEPEYNWNFKCCVPSQLVLAQHLFIDAMEAEALKRSEGDRDKLRNTFRIMWGRPEGAKARKAAEEQASRIWARISPSPLTHQRR